MNITVPVNDAREIEVLASGLPMHHGAQLAVDITLRSAVNALGGACANAEVGTEKRRKRTRRRNRKKERM